MDLASPSTPISSDKGGAFKYFDHDNTLTCPSSPCSITTCSVLSDFKIQHIDGILRQLNANELAALRPLIQSHIEQRKILERIQSCDSTRFDALMTQHHKINDFLYRVEAKDIEGLKFLIKWHEEMKKVAKKRVAEERQLLNSWKPEEALSMKDVLRRFDATEIGHTKILFEQCVHDREGAASIPHPSRCFFLELPQELRDRVYVILGRKYIEAALDWVRQLSKGPAATWELSGPSDWFYGNRFAIFNINHQIRVEFTDILYGPEVLISQIWDTDAVPPSWKPMPRSLLESCFQEPFRRQRTCHVEARSILKGMKRSRWPPEMLETLSVSGQGPNPSSRSRLDTNHWISIKATRQHKHIFASCQRRTSSQAFRLWACEDPVPAENRPSARWSWGCLRRPEPVPWCEPRGLGRHS